MTARPFLLPRLTSTEPDASLLYRFVHSHDEAAFTELVQRHGSLVLAVCRRIVSDSHLAEDAFQATFVVLARKAETIRGCQLSTWLHSVAVKVSLRARTMAGRRAKRETLSAYVPDRPVETSEDASFETTEVIDEEITALPEHLREAMVLCELRGVSRREAARQLGIAEGTLSSRLAAGRKRLAERLRARGFAPAMGILAAALVPAELTAAAVAVSLGKAVLGPELRHLVKGGMTVALTLKLKLVSVGVVFAMLAVGLFGSRWENQSTAAPVPKSQPDPGVIWCYDWTNGKLLAYRPNGDKLKEWTLPYGNWFKGITPDGTRFVYGAEEGNKVPKVIVDDRPTLLVHSRPIDDEEHFTDLGVKLNYLDRIQWTSDGKRFFRLRYVGEKLRTTQVTLYDAAGKELKELTLQDRFPIGWTADSHGLVLDDAPDDNMKGSARFVTLDWKTGKTSPLFSTLYFDMPRLSPDGKKVLGFDTYAPMLDLQKPNKAALVHDLASGKTTEVIRREKQSQADGLWSPDSQWIAYRWCHSNMKALGGGAVTENGDWNFSTCDVNGKNESTLFTGAVATLQVTAWTATPPALKNAKSVSSPKKNAPVPKAKEDTMGLSATVTFEQKEIMLGEPVHFTFAVKNSTDAAWNISAGGDYRNRLGRPESFTVTVTDADGKPIPQPDAGLQLGGLSYRVELPANGNGEFQPLFLPHWATFEKPGQYTVVVRRKLSMVPLDAADPSKAKSSTVTLTATAKITVTEPDTKRFGNLIDTLAKEMLDPKSKNAETATKKLLEIHDPRVIPHFIELGKQPRSWDRSTACRALGHFKTDEAFKALKALYATTGPDLRGSAVNEQLEASGANGVRHSAVVALAECGHKDSLPFVWKAAEDGYDGVRLSVLHKAFEVKSPEARAVILKLTKDGDERVRNEALRYANLLAKEKK